MATSQILKDDFLTCQICFEVYQNPRTFPCEHSYCHGCLTKYIKTQTEAVKSKSIPCPSCRRQIPVPNPARPMEEWATQFKTGLVIQGLMDSFGQSRSDSVNCSVCKDEGKTTPATHWCSECDGSLCGECLRQHNRMLFARNHGVSDLTGETPREQVRKKKFVCKKHDEKIKLFCKDCEKTLCTVCCSVGHKACKYIVEIQEMLPEIKQKLLVRQTRIVEKLDATSKHIRTIKKTNDEFAAKTEKVKSEVNQTFNTIADLLQRMQKQLLDNVDDIKDKQTGELKAKIKCEEIARQTYQQESQFIQQALKFEDEAQLYEMYLSSGSEDVTGDTETYSEDKREVVDISFTHNMEKLRADINMMIVTTVCEDVIDLTAPPVIDLTASPVLQEVVDMRLDEGGSNLRDVVIVNKNGIRSIVATDYGYKAIKSVYVKDGRTCSSQLKLSHNPYGLAVLTQTKLTVSLPHQKQILTVGVNPDLVLLSTITTSKGYYGLAVLDQSTLVAGSWSPSSVDVLDMTGNVLRSFTTLTSIQKSFKDPHYLHVTNNGNILVSDYGLKSVICLTLTGEVVFHYSPTGDRALAYIYGITSTTTGDILLAEYSRHKVIHLTQSGEFVKDILTSQDGLQRPIGLCVDGDKMYVATQSIGVHVFKFS